MKSFWIKACAIACIVLAVILVVPGLFGIKIAYEWFINHYDVSFNTIWIRIALIALVVLIIGFMLWLSAVIFRVAKLSKIIAGQNNDVNDFAVPVKKKEKKPKKKEQVDVKQPEINNSFTPTQPKQPNENAYTPTRPRQNFDNTASNQNTGAVICPKCGKQLPPGSKFCSNCGTLTE